MAEFSNSAERLVVYLALRYTKPSFERLTRALYLVDWTASVWFKHQLTDCAWTYSQSGPIAAEIEDAVALSNYMRWDTDRTIDSPLYSIVDISLEDFELSREEKLSIEYVLSQTVSKTDKELGDMVSTTYPVIATNFGERMNLPELSVGYLAAQAARSKK